MLMVQGKLISDEVISRQFLCDLSACKGACCWEGDFGAPLEAAEMDTLDNIYEEIRPYLGLEGRAVIEEAGKYVYYPEPEFQGTPLLENGACAYMVFDDAGIAQCGIEKAYDAGVITFKKPISCHLYPLRVNSEEALAFEAINYDDWEICSPACANGKRAALPVYQFVKEGLIRKYGLAFYKELDAAAHHSMEQSEEL